MTMVVFGDVHGDAQKLEELITLARERYGSPTFYSLGDLVDRGPNSKLVVELCVRERVSGILGNHELWLCSVLLGHPMNDLPYATIMGGLATIRSYGLERGDPDRVGTALRRMVPRAHQEWLLSLPPYRILPAPRPEKKKLLLVHTGIATGELPDPWPEGWDEEDVVHYLAYKKSATFFWTGPKPGLPEKVVKFNEYIQVFGHTPIPAAITVEDHYVALDTGCGTCPPHALSAKVFFPDGTTEDLVVR